VLLLVCLNLYHSIGAGWGWFFLLFLWPDLFMVGYLKDERIGAGLYNLAHFAAFPASLGSLSYAMHWGKALPFALVWAAHIEFDRVLGYGLKYPTFFKDTHLQRVNS
jgi:hypothetical protein